MSFKERSQATFYFKIGKTFTVQRQAYTLFRRVREHLWLQRFESGREDINKNQRVGQLKFGITQNSIETVRDFIKNLPIPSLKLVDMKLNISKTSIFRIFIEHFGLR